MQEADLRQVMRQIGWTPADNGKIWLNGPCPIARWTHQGGVDRHPSFGVRINDEGPSGFICHSCKRQGRISHLLRLISTFEGIDLNPIIRHAELSDHQVSRIFDYDQTSLYATSRGEPLGEPLDADVYDGLYPCALDSSEATAYLQARGLARSTVETLEILCDPDEHRVMFPVRDREGLLYGYTGRAYREAVEPKVRDYGGLPKRHLILGEHLWQDGIPVVLVEGAFDYAVSWQHAQGKANVGCLLGSVLTIEKAYRLCTVEASKIYLFLDNDDAGRDGTYGRKKEDGRRDRAGAVWRLQGHAPLFIANYTSVYPSDPGSMNRSEFGMAIKQARAWYPSLN